MSSFDGLGRLLTRQATRFAGNLEGTGQGVEGTSLQAFEFDGLSRLRIAADKPGCVTFRPQIPETGRYRLAMRWVQQISSPIRYAKQGTVEVVTDRATESMTVNQSVGGGTWTPLGVFRFSPDAAGVRVHSGDASGVVQADAIRLTPVDDTGDSIR